GCARFVATPTCRGTVRSGSRRCPPRNFWIDWNAALVSRPRDHGNNVVTAAEAMIRGEVKFFVAMGGNFAVAIPDWKTTQAALRNLELTVHVSTKLNRSHLVHGREALILPCLGRPEIDFQASGPQSITVEDSMSMVHASAGRNRPASEHLMSEPAIVAGVARATLGVRSKVNWEEFVGDYDLIRDAVE